ncbi:ATP-binding protein [Ferrigenium sp. UT5]|uniref:hybrid sensor histidine kinase/response regulator n=1 Tax=Ferrigenium sp. UT5 TaxID=3242105 RepID=UPI00354CE6C7
MKHYGIQRQALAVALIPVLILAALLEGAFLYYRMGEEDRALLDRAELIAKQLAVSSEYAVFAANQGALQQLLEGVMWQKDVQAVRVLDGEGNLLAVAGNSGWNEMPPVLDGELLLWQNDVSLCVYRPIVATQLALDDSALKAPVPAAGRVELLMSKRRLHQSKFELVLFSLLLTALVLLASVLVAMGAARRITLPIFGMRAAVRDLGEGRLDTRIAEMQVIELNELGQGINEMALQLQQQQQHLQLRIDQATQALREKKDEAEKANFDKTRFLAAASHDLRQPMHALGLFMGELHHRINTQEQREIVDKVEEAVSAMSGLLESLLDISKLDAGVVVPQVQAIDILPLTRRLLEVFQEQAAQKFIILRLHCRAVRVFSDPILLERIMLNLLGNAVRYTPPHGTVLLACRMRGNRLRIEVRDNGTGIAPQDQTRVFQEFVQLENAARERSKGLGLGLPIVERLCKLLQYPLTLHSALGVGTTFSVEVPLVQALSQLRAEPTHPLLGTDGAGQEFSGLKVLVVDDDELVRKGTNGLLTSWGCLVSTAENLVEVRALRDRTFDLVISDYRLPDGNGLELFDCIQANCAVKPAFILISGDISPEILQQVAAHGLPLLHKPVRPAKLRSLMRSLHKH